MDLAGANEVGRDRLLNPIVTGSHPYSVKKVLSQCPNLVQSGLPSFSNFISVSFAALESKFNVVWKG